ncbi:MAG: ribosomal protein S18-alanine N-acetyltransferase [Myxococcaceae bacterium]|nr:ribosomal protein S18-alanine N-acetyltransferase [Myxococcaceae bacterium]MCI0670412.1 ribosomal protein S18-alanine N-acetyltransferase [Myxococcaceae bacterium]
MEVAFRPMLLGDLEDVMALERRAFRNPWSAELLRRELEHEWSTILLAETAGGGGRPVLLGLCIYWVVHDEVHVLNVATEPAHQRRGVARSLLEEALARGRSRRCTLATLEVRRSNVPAIALYQGLGFRQVGVRPNYYSDEGEDALVMVLDL